MSIELIHYTLKMQWSAIITAYITMMTLNEKNLINTHTYSYIKYPVNNTASMAIPHVAMDACREE